MLIRWIVDLLQLVQTGRTNTSVLFPFNAYESNKLCVCVFLCKSSKQNTFEIEQKANIRFDLILIRSIDIFCLHVR